MTSGLFYSKVIDLYLVRMILIWEIESHQDLAGSEFRAHAPLILIFWRKPKIFAAGGTRDQMCYAETIGKTC